MVRLNPPTARLTGVVKLAFDAESGSPTGVLALETPAVNTVIIGDGLRLEKWGASHIEELSKIVDTSLEHIASWMPNAAAEVADPMAFVQGVERAWRSGRVYAYAIVEQGGQVSGHITLTPETPVAGVGYWVRIERLRRGIATRAVRALAVAAFDERPDLTTLELTCDEANTASASVARAAGFTHVTTRHRDPRTPAESGQQMLWRLSRGDPGRTSTVD
jgi:RimJ/RimL family protein N-acetyltransferase